MGYNTIPLDDFSGLTPNKMHELLYHPFERSSPVCLRDVLDDTILNEVPLFLLAEEYLKILAREKQIKLTPLGFLPKKIMVELYDKKILPDEHIEAGLFKLNREQDCISIMSMRYTMELGGLVKKQNGNLSLTKKGILFGESQSRLQFFKLFFQSFTEKFSWGYNDGYTEAPIGQFGWGFSLYLLHKLGNKLQNAEFYAQKYITAFPQWMDYFESDKILSAKDEYTHCYGIRVFERFLLWFGFVKVERKNIFTVLKADTFSPTDVINKIFVFG